MLVQPNHSGNACLFRIAETDRRRLEALLFKRYPRREWGTFFLFGYRITPWGLHAPYVELFDPGVGDLDDRSGIVEFSARYILRAQLKLEATDLAIGVVHSHPQGCGTGASMLDDDMDSYFSHEFRQYGGGRPYVSLRVARDSNGFRFSGEARVEGVAIPVTDFLTVGQDLTRDISEWKESRNNGHIYIDESRER